MTHIARGFLALLFSLLAAMPAAFAQAPRTYSQAELDQMLAPIALYPDALLSQVLMAATYPAEVGEAARWSRANPGLQGDNAVRAVGYEDWDPSVKSLVAFPQILAWMDENPGWILALGDAFLMQEPHVMDTVQQLRRRAQAAGNLQSSEQMLVRQQGQSIVVQPASPQYVYVPYYDPLAVYGPWWWPAYQPVVWAPWPGYARPYRPGASAGFWWGMPIGLSLNFFFGNVDWHHRHVRVAHPTVYYYRPAVVLNRTPVLSAHRWQHEPRRPEAFADRRPIQVKQQIQMQSQAQSQERRIDRQPAPVQPQPAAIVRAQPRPQPEAQSAVQVQPAVRAQPAIRAQPEVRGQPQPQSHREQRARMPEAVAPQQPRAERHEQRQEHREIRLERRNERGQKG